MQQNDKFMCVGQDHIENHPGTDGSFYFSDAGCRDLAPQQTSNSDRFWISVPYDIHLSLYTKKNIIFCFTCHLIPETSSKERIMVINGKTVK